ncbi:MAG: DMT family transporter [Candidatus Heimdallarchaeota archaeon]|nr:DMT family transporter [Candidatus Heimdallarchaeota archaeon]
MTADNIFNSKALNFGPVFIALAAFLWATDVFVRTDLQDKLTPIQIVLVEHLFIMIALSPLLVKYVPKLTELNLKEVFSVLFIGIGGSAIATIALTEGFFTGDFPFQYVAVVVFLQQTQPIIAVGLAHLLLKERLPRTYYLFAMLSFTGVVLIIFPTLTGGTNKIADLSNVIDNMQKDDGSIAAMYGLLAAVLWGSSTVFGRYLMEHGEQKPAYFQMTTYRFFVAFIFLLILTPLIDDLSLYTKSNGYPSTSTVFEIGTFLRLVYIATIVGLLSLLFYYKGLKTTHASVSAIAELAFPLAFYVIMPLRDIDYPETIQIVGSILLVLAATMMSYTYGKLETDNPPTSPSQN